MLSSVYFLACTSFYAMMSKLFVFCFIHSVLFTNSLDHLSTSQSSFPTHLIPHAYCLDNRGSWECPIENVSGEYDSKLVFIERGEVC